MGCFTTCFSNCKPSRRRRRRRSFKSCQHPSLFDHLQNYQSVEDFKVPHLIQQQEEDDAKCEEQEQEQEQEGEENEKNNSIEMLHDSIDEKREEKANKSGRKKVTFDLNVKFYENLTKEEEEETEEITEEINEENRKNDEKKVTVCECASDSSSSSLFSYPLNHRYQNTRDSDDEFDDILSSDADDYDGEDEDEDDDEDNDDENVVQSSESLFSLSIDSRKHKLSTVGGDKEVNSPMQVKNAPGNDSECRFDRGKYVDSVLNPVENLTQWKDIKARSRVMSKNEPKENLNTENSNSVQDFSFPVKKEMLQGKKEIAVDTSLSTWLVGSENGGSQRSNSRNSSVSVGNSQSDRKKPVAAPNKFEDRPILGALTVEEIRQMSASSTPRKSPGRSPDDMPIIGSVGSYWSRTGQTTDSGGSSIKSTKSRYRESAEVIWDSTPFETRLEKALEKEANSEGVFAV